MAYNGLAGFIQKLENEGELIRVRQPVNPRFEMAEITDRMIKSGGKALLFENSGTSFPVLMNAFGSMRRMCLALGVDKLDQIGMDIESLFKEMSLPRNGFLDKLKIIPSLKEVAGWYPKQVSGRGKCQEVVMMQPDLAKIPVITCWPNDGGPFITLPVVHTKNPANGIRNVGMYRMQVFDRQTTGMHWHLHKGSAKHYQVYKKAGLKMPVAVVLGGDPVYTYVATAPLPENIDEYFLAGFLRKKRVEMVKCLSIEMEVPSDADIVIEGYVDPSEDLRLEGPFGDHTGYYSLADYYPAFHVNCITHRKDAVYPSTIVGIPPQEDLFLGKATERIFLNPIRLTLLPEITDMAMPAEGVFHNFAVVSARNDFPGQAARVMNSLWGAGQMMFNKVLLVVDEDVDLGNYEEVARNALSVFDPKEDVIIGQGPLDVLDHAGLRFAFGGKMGLVGMRKDKAGKIEGTANRPGQAPEKMEAKVEVDRIMAKKGVKGMNPLWLKKDIPLLIISLHKDKRRGVREFCVELMTEGLFEGIKILVITEEVVDPCDISTVVWKVSNNIEPINDCYVIDYQDNDKSLLVIDGTRKTAGLDGFTRDWPNIVVSDEDTISRVDQMWPELGLGPFILSPSLHYRGMLYGSGAIAED